MAKTEEDDLPPHPNPPPRGGRGEKVNDRTAIRELLSRYARALDLRDFDAVARCFAADARAVYSGVELAPGVESIIEHLNQMSSIPASTHLIGNVLIQLDGDSAEVDSQAVVHLVLDRGPEARVRIRGLYYHDRVVRQGGSWVIAERVHRADWSLEVAGVGQDVSPPSSAGGAH